MSWSCLSDHRLSDAYDATGARKWHNGCAVCEVERLQAEIERLHGVVSHVNRRCDHLGISLREVKAERDALRAAIARACHAYPSDDAAPTCVAILREALLPNAELSGPQRPARKDEE